MAGASSRGAHSRPSCSFAVRQHRQFQASANVLISHQNTAAQLTGTQDASQAVPADRFIETQADLARVRDVAKLTPNLPGSRNRSSDAFLGLSSVSAKTNADLLVFKVRDRVPGVAIRLANIYAAQFTNYRHELDTAALRRARQEVEQRLRQLEAQGETHSALYASLADKDQQLRTLEALQTSNAYVVETADTAPQVAPRPVRNGVLGFILGLFVGLAVAFVWEALDTRVRTTEEISTRLRLPLLGRLPEPSKRLRTENKLVMVEDPRGIEAEAFRVFRTNLDFANFERGARTIMVTSAVQGEGKSTTVANLAIALARGGRHVIVVDCDLRRPYCNRFFGLDRAPRYHPTRLWPMPTRPRLRCRDRLSRTNRPVPRESGGNGSAILQREARGHRLGNAAARSWRVHQHTRLQREARGPGCPGRCRAGRRPAVARSGRRDQRSGKVDAMLVVTRLNVVRRPMLHELHRILESCPAAKLGFVLAGAQSEEGYAEGYRYSYYHYQSRDREAVT